MLKGFTGKILMVDLGSGDISEQAIPESVYEHYLAGQGLAAYILYKEIPPEADPLGPDNVLGFVPGLLTGTPSFFTGRWTVVGKSPLTGCWGDANCGGNLSPAIKRCGYDGIFFKGISEKPVYLLVTTGGAELQDASHLWGTDAVQTEAMLQEAHGADSRVACIGMAGEKLSLISGIANDSGRMAARSGLGAVMGSKRLKAIVLRGKARVGCADPEKMKRLSKACNRWVQFQLPLVPGFMMAYVGALMRIMPTQMAMDGFMLKLFLRKWGTISMNQTSVEMGDTPIKNWDGSNVDFNPEKSKLTNPDLLIARDLVRYHCYACPLGCGGKSGMKDVGRGFDETHRPEYESVLALTGLCMNENADDVFYLNEILNRAGMDTISAGGTVAFAIECFENGILTKEDTDGLELKWGNSEAVVALIEKMIKREGIGDLLADGTKIAAKKIGKNAEQFAMHVRGQEPPMHDGRNDPGFNVHYTVEPTPGRHTIGSYLYYEMFRLWTVIGKLPKPPALYFKRKKYIPDEDKAIMAASCSKYMNIVNSVGACLFGTALGAKRVPLFAWLNAATGWQKTPEEYMEIGQRIQTLKQSFNIKQGVDPASIKVPDRLLGRPVQTEGANKGCTVPIEKMRSDYWRQFGWDPVTGIPSGESREDMKLDLISFFRRG